jgi:hypothetical protein
MKTITRLLYELNQQFSSHILAVISRLSLREDKLLELEGILNFKQKEDEESFT